MKMKVVLPAIFTANRARQAEQQQALQQHACLMADLRECKNELERTDALFNLMSEPELIESCVYEYAALRARYNCLMRKARETAQ